MIAWSNPSVWMVETSIIICPSRWHLYIGYRAFANCPSLASARITESVRLLGRFAFEGCESLATITVPESLRFEVKGAFDVTRFGDYHSTMMMKTCCLHLATLLARVTLTLWYQWHWSSDLSRHFFHTTPGCLQEKTARFPWRPIRGITWLAHVHSPTMLKKAWENTPNRKHIFGFL